MTTPSQEAAHKAAVTVAEGARQSAHGAAKLSFNGTPAAYPAFDAAIKAADAANMRAIIASAAAQGLEGPRQSLFYLTGSWT